ncbi:YybH family protein [Rhodoferax sp. UBA5149]|uniref:YybH family protein n=1 Tax=Rhodoferax sp. UBA5149 TaxID=1947379 RepID=UPI0025E7BC20|nr:tetratricopeptide repeat protein [Rhodoferax sp. UBA5149]
MKHARSILFTTLRLLTVAAACAMTSAYADDYVDVSQLLRAGKLSEAMTKADVYLAAKPRDPQMRFLKGVIQRNTGKQADAIATFTKLTEDYPELPEPYNNLAVLYAGQNQFDKARAALEMAIRTNPSYATAHENLGDVYARLASQAYNKALQLDGTNAAVPPKLALIRELFKPNIKGQTPALAVAAPAGSATVVVKAPVAVSTPAAAPAAPVVTAASPAIAAAAGAVPAKPTVSDSAVKDAEAAVHAWAKAWSAKDMSAYLGAYGKEFTPPAKQSRSAWEQERRNRIAGKSSIRVKLENLTVTVNGSKAVAKFRQDYRANALAVSSRKTLELLKTGDKWLIVRESTGN